jgi:FHS family glucose/mannose:H+ symporter-like MFS transporter
MIMLGAFVSMSFLGMSRTFLGTALPAIRSSLDLTLLQAGTLMALLQLGFAIAVFVGGPLSDVLKKSSILMLGCFLMGLNLLLFGFSNWFWITLLGAALIGIGGGLIESSSNPLLIQLFPGKESTVMNLHHFFFAAGSLSGPVIMGTVLAKSMPWQWAYLGFGLFVLVVFCLLLSLKISSAKGDRGLEVNVISRFMSEKTFLILFFVTFFIQGVQNGISYWMVTFLKETRGFPIALASASLFLFFVSLALGRLFSSYLITKFQEPVYLLGLFSFLFAALFMASSVPGKWTIIFFALCGFAHSGVFPCLLAMAGKLYPENPGTAMGLVATGSGIGAMAIPWFMSLISQVTTLQTGFLSFEIFVMISLLLMSIHFKRFSLAKSRA